MHHPRADIERLHIKRENDGRGLIQQKLDHRKKKKKEKKRKKKQQKKTNSQTVIYRTYEH